MSKAEIMRELPRLRPEERREIFERIGELEDQDLLTGGQPSPEEKALLDSELEDYKKNPGAGSPLEEVEARLRKFPHA